MFVCLFGFFFGCSRLFCNSMKIKKSFEPPGTGGCWSVMTTGIAVVDFFKFRFDRIICVERIGIIIVVDLSFAFIG